MSRGMPSRKALAAAVVVAGARGRVLFLKDSPGPAYDFLILTPYGVIAVTVRRTRHIRDCLEGILHDFREILDLIRAGDTCPGVYCEFWLWSPAGAMRFFQLEGFRLTELGITGLPLMPPVTGTFPGPVPPGDAQGIIPAGRPPGPGRIPDTHAGTAAGRDDPGQPAAPGPALPTAADQSYARFLRNISAAIRRQKEAGGAVGDPPAGHSPARPAGKDGVSPLKHQA